MYIINYDRKTLVDKTLISSRDEGKEQGRKALDKNAYKFLEVAYNRQQLCLATVYR